MRVGNYNVDTEDEESDEPTYRGIVAATQCDCCSRRLKIAFRVSLGGEILNCGPTCAAGLLGCSEKDLRAVARLERRSRV